MHEAFALWASGLAVSVAGRATVTRRGRLHRSGFSAVALAVPGVHSIIYEARTDCARP